MSDADATTSPDPPSTATDPPALLSPLPLILPAGGISLLAGSPGVGKTALLATFLRDLLKGLPVFGRQPTRIPGLGVINTDRGWAEGAGLWFARAGFPDVAYYSLADDATLPIKRLRKKWERLDLLFEAIDRLALPWGSVIVVDPVALFLGGNLIDYDTCAVACYEIRRMLRIRGLTMIATAHAKKLAANKKDRYLRLQDQILGSTALFGFTDTQMYLAAPDELQEDYYVFLWQPHMLPAESFMLKRDDQGLFMPYADAIGATRESKRSAQDESILQLLPADGAILALGAILEAAMAQGIPLSRRTIIRILERLMKAGLIDHAGYGCYRRATQADVINS